MRRAFVDTSFLVAYYYREDPWHKVARDVYAGLQQGEAARLIITDYIFDECMTAIQRATSRRDAIEVGRLLLRDPGFEMQWIGEMYFEQAWQVFERFQDKRWSFTDCTSYVWIRENKPDFCLATDPDFDQFGLVPNLVRS